MFPFPPLSLSSLWPAGRALFACWIPRRPESGFPFHSKAVRQGNEYRMKALIFEIACRLQAEKAEF
ncbi:MAG: hypothetical protein C6P35_13070 [Cohnella sp.]|nr:MAG: hypothetical protein C6P35_13070 [Cohnella sp.]